MIGYHHRQVAGKDVLPEGFLLFLGTYWRRALGDGSQPLDIFPGQH